MSCFSKPLLDAGFLLQGTVPFADLDSRVVEQIRAAGVSFSSGDRLIFFGQAGPRLWDALISHNLHYEDPFDEASIKATSTWMSEAYPAARFDVVYPESSALLPLGQLGTQLGWGESSPLGLSIHADYGLWNAHRVVAVTDAPIDHIPEPAPSPCSSCSTTDCVSACPVDAVSVEGAFDLTACARHRVSDGSPCASQCLSRNACPVGADYRYGEAQMTHHYGSGLASIRRWIEGTHDA